MNVKTPLPYCLEYFFLQHQIGHVGLRDKHSLRTVEPARVAQVEESLQKAHGDLEERVRVRTAELNEINLKLRLEIADRQRAENELRENEKRFRSLFESSTEFIHILDIDGNLMQTNPETLRRLGYREDEVDEAVIRQIRDRGFCFTLTQRYQNELAKKLRELVPCAQMSVFLKTGSDATTASIRIARAYTNRVKVMRCGGSPVACAAYSVSGGGVSNVDRLYANAPQHGATFVAANFPRCRASRSRSASS